jgi:hypothetical protein
MTTLRYWVDRADPELVQGWAFAADGLQEVRLRAGELVIASAPIDGERPDVHSAHPSEPGSLRSGFTLVPPLARLERPTCSVELEFVHRDGRVERPERYTMYVPGRSPATAALPRAPFPPSVLRIVADLRGADHWADGAWSDARDDEVLADLELVIAHGPKHVAGLYGYLGWMRQQAERLAFVERHFPRRNPERSDPHDKDFLAVGSTWHEMLTIVHHLYVLRAHGLSGSLLEFGCFKGFSTACLSQACAQLGIGMDVFDSFAGLPHTDSSYHGHGEFAGSLEEVRGNVREFGDVDAVRFHPGFFADTLPGRTLDPIAIWMDVDLRSSSRDVMTVLDRLPAASCVFSHECEPGHFASGGTRHGRGADDVVGPIVEAFERVGRRPTGRFLSHHTGAFWDRADGIPVLSTERVLRLVALG